MVGTRKLARLLAHAETAGAKIVLVGDPCQLPEIEAGGAFPGLRARLGASALTENRRQTQRWERDALAELRDGDPDRALDTYLDRRRVHQAATDVDAREQLVAAWMRARVEGDDVLMVAARLADVDDLNRRARRTLQDEGQLNPDRVVFGGRAFTQGDHIVCLRNNYELGVLNGTRGVIRRIDIGCRTLEIATGASEVVAIPFEYATDGHLTHGYATTIHKAQGATVDRCLVLADDTTSREHAYTALSRGRHGNELYVVAAQDDRSDERHANEHQPDPLASLRAAVRRTARKDLALEGSAPSSRAADELRRQRDELRHGLGSGPDGSTREFRRLSAACDSAQRLLDEAVRQRDRARRDLDRLGPLRRRLHPSRWHSAQQRRVATEAAAVRYAERVELLDAQLSDLAPIALERLTWEAEHRHDLDRLDRLDRQIEVIDRLDHVASRSVERSVELGRGIEL